jgi:hypothetical protein
MSSTNIEGDNVINTADATPIPAVGHDDKFL